MLFTKQKVKVLKINAIRSVVLTSFGYYNNNESIKHMKRAMFCL